MGNRANVFVTDNGKDGVYLYTHCGGDELPIIVKAALRKSWRWYDAPYLARIIFDEMTAKCHGEETGFGIWFGLCDNEHLIVQVDCRKARVSFVPASDIAAKPLKVWSFAEYTVAAETEILAAYRQE
jgi:hypothetical protein